MVEFEPEFTKTGRKWKANEDSLRWWRRVSYSAAVIGRLISIAGFWLWMSRHQRHQDRLLRAKMQEAEKKANASTPPPAVTP